MRFTAISKNTSEKPWVTTRSRKYAIPFAFSVNKLFIKRHDINISRYPTSENSNSTLNTKLVIKYKFKNGEETDLLNLKSRDDTPLKYTIEDVFVDSSLGEVKLLRGILVIENSGVNNIFRWTGDLGYDPKSNLKLAEYTSILKKRKEAKKRAVESAKETISNSDVLIVKSVSFIKTHSDPINLYKIVIVPQEGQMLNGWTLVKDENIGVMTSGIDLGLDKKKSTQDKLIFYNVTLKNESFPLYVTIEKNSVRKKVYLDD